MTFTNKAGANNKIKNILPNFVNIAQCTIVFENAEALINANHRLVFYMFEHMLLRFKRKRKFQMSC